MSFILPHPHTASITPPPLFKINIYTVLYISVPCSVSVLLSGLPAGGIHLGDSLPGETSLWLSKPLTSLWIFCSSLMESFRDPLGDNEARWLLDLCTGRSDRGLDSLLLPGLDPSEPAFKLVGRPVVKRLVLGGIATGI